MTLFDLIPEIPEPLLVESPVFPPVLRVQLLKEDANSYTDREEVKGHFEAAAILRRYLQHEDREHFVAMMLDVKNRVIGIHTVSIGILNAALVTPREVFKAAILSNAMSVVLGHNHPSGDPTPSPEDLEITERLKKAGEILGIEVLDHVIIGEGEMHCSLRSLGKC